MFRKIINIKFVKNILILFLVIQGTNSFSQFYNGSNLTFGKNRVQYQNYNWVYYRGDRCDVYFYHKSKQLAQYVLKYASNQIEDMERTFGNALEDKIQFVVYATYADYKESNIGLLNDNVYNTGGQTSIAGNKVILFFDQGYQQFDNQMKSGISAIFISEMLYGGSVISQVRNSALSSLSLWFESGLLSYYASPWDTKIDNEIRNLISTAKYQKLNRLNINESRIAGHAIWHYVSEKYGALSIPSIISYTRSLRNIDRAFLYSLGVSFNTLYEESVLYYANKYENDLKKSSPENKLLKKQKLYINYSQIKISTDGYNYAWVTNESGQAKIWLMLKDKKKPKRIFKRFHRIDDNPDFSFPLLAWNPNGDIISYAIEEEGKMMIYNYDITTKNTNKFQIFHLNKITSLSYSPDGKLLIFSGVKDSQSDIYVFNLTSRSYTQITNDIYDDFAPQFILNSSKIIFSSNRVNDTIYAPVNISREALTSKYNLFLYNYKTKDSVLTRLTNTPNYSEIMATEISKNKFVYLSDNNGIVNRYIAQFDSTLSHIDTAVHYRYYTKSAPITDYNSSIIEHDYNDNTGTFAEILINNGINKIYTEPETTEKYDFKATINPSSYKLDEELKEYSTKTDSSGVIKKGKKKITGKRLVSVKISEAYKDAPNVVLISGSQKQILIKDTSDANNANNDLKPNQVERNAYIQYSISQLISQLDFSFMNTSYQQFTGGSNPVYLNAGFNALFMVGTQDLLEDHRIMGGFRLTSSLDNIEYLLSYEMLGKRLDKQIIFHRQQFKNFGDYDASKQVSNAVYYILKWPFNNVNSIRGTIIGRYDKLVTMSTSDLSLAEPNKYGYWSGLKAEWVFDNSRSLGVNLYRGTRAKLFGEYYQSVEDKNKNLFVVGGDARHYIKIHKTFIWANRIAASTSFGKNKLIYYMGGVDNWLFAKFNKNINIATDQNYTYQTLATNMRGFTQNIRNGNSFAVINSELRFPLVKYFVDKPLRSEFLNTLQLVTFGDLGTAWTGSNPYSDKNALFTQIIQSGPIRVTLEKQTDPIVGGYGFGLRSKILGYFVRVDWAWGVEDRVVQPSVFYFSLNLDF